MTAETLQEAIALAREGRKTEARWLLESLLQDDQANETAWLWYAACVETFEQRVAALENCLRANPRASRARVGLSLLNKAAVPGALRAAAWADFLKGVLSEKPLPASRGKMTEEGLVVVTGGSGLAPTTPALNERLLAVGQSAPKDEGVFTVAPDALTEQEFSEIEERESSFMAAHPELNPLYGQQAARAKPPRRVEEDWEELSKTGAPRVPASHNVPTQPAPAQPRTHRSRNVPSSYNAPTVPRPVPARRPLISPLVVVLLVLVIAVLLGVVLSTAL